jgi:hypothetical protein
MSKLKKLCAATFLTCALGLTAFADCPAPGAIGTPPCVPAAQTAPDDPIANPTAPGQTETPPAIDSVDLISVAEIALNSLMLF